MTSEHTPGPWWVLDGLPEVPHRMVAILKIEPLGPRIAIEAADSPATPATIRANAALIAAAPELKEALRRWMVFDEIDGREQLSKEFGAPVTEDSSIASEGWLERVLRGPSRAALRKALGTTARTCDLCGQPNDSDFPHPQCVDLEQATADGVVNYG